MVFTIENSVGVVVTLSRALELSCAVTTGSIVEAVTVGPGSATRAKDISVAAPAPSTFTYQEI